MVLKFRNRGCSCMQDYGGAVVIGDDVQASFSRCSFTNNGRGLCADQDITLVSRIDKHSTPSSPPFFEFESVLHPPPGGEGGMLIVV